MVCYLEKKIFWKMFNVPNYPSHSDADPRIQEIGIWKLEELRIAEYPPSPNLYRTMPVAVGTQYDLSETCLEEIVVEKMFSPRTSEKNTKKCQQRENSAFWTSSDTNTPEKITEFICPPDFCKKPSRKKDIKPEKRETDYDSDDTCDEYVECGEKGMCKCQKMRGREYYEYYERNKEKDLYTMYTQGRCVLPKGAVLHFTGAPKNMRREDVHEVLAALGAKIEFVDYHRGSKEGWVRLSFPYEAKIIIKKMIDKKNLKITGAVLEFRVLSGKEEKRYHKKAIEAIYQLEEKSKGLAKHLRKVGCSYVSK